MKIILLSIVAMVMATPVFADPIGNPEYRHPVIKDHGGIVALPDAALPPQKNSKVIIDITSDEQSGGVLKGFDRAALILNQYTQASAGIEHGFKMAVILHGPATKAALSHEAYAKHTNSYIKDLGKTQNPDLALIRELKKAGVDIYVCGQAAAHHGYATSDIAPEVKIAVSAATVNINLQMDNYAYLSFKQ
ncbi:MAG: hypothetical protein NPIRA03_27650 [Nitrospirales bacterium]|nr:MAG: hypothetical protein NPIRA03_27650 [Nitrospirales bacterium]